MSSLLPASLLSLEHNQPNNNYRADQKCKSRKSYFVSDLSDIVYFFLSVQNIILIFECVFFNSHFFLETNVCNSASHHNFDMCVCIIILIFFSNKSNIDLGECVCVSNLKRLV